MNTKIVSVLREIRTHADPPNRERMTLYEQRHRGGPRYGALFTGFVQEKSTNPNPSDYYKIS